MIIESAEETISFRLLSDMAPITQTSSIILSLRTMTRKVIGRTNSKTLVTMMMTRMTRTTSSSSNLMRT